MTGPTSIRLRTVRLLAIIACLSIICCASLPSVAQTPPAPGPQQPTLNTGRSRSLGEQIAALNVRVRQLMPVLQTEMLRLIRWVEYFAWLIALLLIPASAVREWHENAGKGRNLFWWFGRLAFCLLLFGSSVALIDELIVAGKEIAEGNEGVSESLLHEFYRAQRESFNESYDNLVDGNFKVKGLNGQEFAVQPVDGTEKFLGVIYDQGTTIRDLNSKLSDSSYTMTGLFALMNVSRGIMEAGDVWLIVLAGLLLMTFKLLAPLMVVLAIDRKISQRTVTAFVWGLVIVTLVWPSVSYFIRALAYMGGNVAMAMGDTDQVYAWSETAQKALRNPLAQPFYTVVVGSLMMLGAGIALWLSPFLAYSFAMGRVFEGVAQQASQIAGSIVGTAAEWVSANIGAKIGRQADSIQLQGSYDAERERARGEFDYANTGAQVRRMSTIAQAQAQRASGLGSVWASWAHQRGTAQNQEMFGVGMAEAHAAYSKMLDANRGGREFMENGISGVQHEKLIHAQSIGESWHLMGLGAGTFSNAPGAPGTVAFGAAGGLHMLAIEEKNRLSANAVQDATDKRADNIQKYYDKQLGTPDQPGVHDQYRDAVIANQKRLAVAQLGDASTGQPGTINVSTNLARDGIKEAAGIQIGTARQVYSLETGANQGRFDAQQRAAAITYDAGVQAANLRAMQHVFSQVAGRMARDIEKGIEMRF
jgi:hypothetical protein